MSRRSEKETFDPRYCRPREPSGPPPGVTQVGRPPAPVTAPRYQHEHGHGARASTSHTRAADREHRPKRPAQDPEGRHEKHRKRRRDDDHTHRSRRGGPEADRDEVEGRRARSSGTKVRPPSPPKNAEGQAKSEDDSSSDSSDSEKQPEENKDKEPAQALEKLQVTKSKFEAHVVIAGRVDDLTARAMSFSRALVRGTQALRTAARIAREAAMSFESEMENFIAAQQDINRTFNIDETNNP